MIKIAIYAKLITCYYTVVRKEELELFLQNFEFHAITLISYKKGSINTSTRFSKQMKKIFI
jgi:hypothetical protein